MEGRTDSIPAALPRGPHGLSPEQVAASQQLRLLHAVTEAASAKGYAAISVSDVIARAGVSRKTFYEHFANKEECFLAAFDHGAAQLATAIVTAANAVDAPDERLHAGYQALCQTLAQMPTYAKAFVAASPEAGSKTAQRLAGWRQASIQRLRDLYSQTTKDGHDLPAELPDHIARAIVGAIDALITDHVEHHGAQSLPTLVPTIVGVARTLMRHPIDPPLPTDR